MGDPQRFRMGDSGLSSFNLLKNIQPFNISVSNRGIESPVRPPESDPRGKLEPGAQEAFEEHQRFVKSRYGEAAHREMVRKETAEAIVEAFSKGALAQGYPAAGFKQALLWKCLERIVSGRLSACASFF
jgi:hypothetical protein